MATFTYIGHGSLKLVTEKGMVIYIDPFSDAEWGFSKDAYTEPADLIMVTHQHFDHNEIDTPAKKGGCQIRQNFDMLVDGEYKTETFGDVTVRAVEAYSASHDKAETVGYYLKIAGEKDGEKRIYIAGDTATTEEMKDLAGEKLDIAFLPIDGIYTMDAEEASACAKTIGARISVPYHTSPGEPFSRDKAETFKVAGRVIIAPGETLTV